MKLRTFVAVVAVVAAACGGGASPLPASQGASAPPAAVAPPSAAEGPVTLTVMQWGNQGDAWWNQRFADFTKQHPNVTFKQEVVPYGQYASKVGAYKTAGSGPDVMQMGTGAYMFDFADMFLPLNGLVDLAAYYGTEAACEDFDCSKTIYGIPWALQGQPLYYNKAVLAAAGLDPATPPKTWKDMDAACAKIKAIGKACIAAGPKDYGGATEFDGALATRRLPLQTARVSVPVPPTGPTRGS